MAVTERFVPREIDEALDNIELEVVRRRRISFMHWLYLKALGDNAFSVHSNVQSAQLEAARSLHQTQRIIRAIHHDRANFRKLQAETRAALDQLEAV